jgi:hypothetical protein
LIFQHEALSFVSSNEGDVGDVGDIPKVKNSIKENQMYRVERIEDEVCVFGPNHYQKIISKRLVGVVLRACVDGPSAVILKSYAVAVRNMSDTEIVACALGIQADERNFAAACEHQLLDITVSI